MTKEEMQQALGPVTCGKCQGKGRIYMGCDEWIHCTTCNTTGKVTAPPQREWQGLTDEDLSVCDEDGVLLARYWEAKLKEKNA